MDAEDTMLLEIRQILVNLGSSIFYLPGGGVWTDAIPPNLPESANCASPENDAV